MYPETRCTKFHLHEKVILICLSNLFLACSRMYLKLNAKASGLVYNSFPAASIAFKNQIFKN